MLCQKCGKNEAEVHFVQTVNGERTEALLCAKCATESGFVAQISFTNFLQGFLDASAPFCANDSENIRCESCGMTLAEMKRDGKAGCSDCYKVFRAQIEVILKNVQAGNTHTGRFPKKASHISLGREISALRQKLAKAVEHEEYEEAALIRDTLRELKEGDSNA